MCSDEHLPTTVWYGVPTWWWPLARAQKKIVSTSTHLPTVLSFLRSVPLACVVHVCDGSHFFPLLRGFRVGCLSREVPLWAPTDSSVAYARLFLEDARFDMSCGFGLFAGYVHLVKLFGCTCCLLMSVQICSFVHARGQVACQCCRTYSPALVCL